jgi:hypothetical protein
MSVVKRDYTTLWLILYVFTESVMWPSILAALIWWLA